MKINVATTIAEQDSASDNVMESAADQGKRVKLRRMLEAMSASGSVAESTADKEGKRVKQHKVTGEASAKDFVAKTKPNKGKNVT